MVRNRTLSLLGLAVVLLSRMGAAVSAEPLSLDEQTALWERQRDEIRTLEERSVIREFPKNVVRDGTKLLFFADNGAITNFEDIDCDCDGYAFATVRQYLPSIDSFLVYQARYEWAEWYLVHRVSGAVQPIVGSITFSPSGDRLISKGFEFEEALFSVVLVADDQFTREYIYGGNCYRDMYWIDDGRIRVFFAFLRLEKMAECAGIDPDNLSDLDTHFDLVWDGAEWVHEPPRAP